MGDASFSTPNEDDFVRMLERILAKRKLDAAMARRDADADAARAGALGSSRLVFAKDAAVSPSHESAVQEAMHLVVDFCQNHQHPLSRLIALASPLLWTLPKRC